MHGQECILPSACLSHNPHAKESATLSASTSLDHPCTSHAELALLVTHAHISLSETVSSNLFFNNRETRAGRDLVAGRLTESVLFIGTEFSSCVVY